MYEVLVACSVDWASPARLPKVLARAGCRVIVMCPAGSPIEITRFAHEVHVAPRDPAHFVSALRRHLAGRSYDWVIIADDPLLFELAAVSDKSWLEGWFPVDPKSEWVGVLASKAEMVLRAGALVTYGRGLDGIAVLEERGGRLGRTQLPTVTIGAVKGQELQTPLGTLIRFQRGGLTYTVVGSVTRQVAEAAARSL